MTWDGVLEHSVIGSYEHVTSWSGSSPKAGARPIERRQQTLTSRACRWPTLLRSYLAAVDCACVPAPAYVPRHSEMVAALRAHSHRPRERAQLGGVAREQAQELWPAARPSAAASTHRPRQPAILVPARRQLRAPRWQPCAADPACALGRAGEPLPGPTATRPVLGPPAPSSAAHGAAWPPQGPQAKGLETRRL